MRGGGPNFRGRGRGGGGHRGSHRGHRGNGGYRGHRGGRRGPHGPSGPSQHQNKTFHQVPGPRLAESDCGITEFISKHDGFSAIMKHRYSDFQVNEIDLDGNVVKLTSLDVPKEEQGHESDVERHKLIPEEIWLKLSHMVRKTAKSVDIKEEEKPDSPPVNSGLQSQGTESKSPTDKQCKENIDETSASPDNSDQVLSTGEKSCDQSAPVALEVSQYVELDVTTLDKESRRAIHNCVKRAFKEVNGNTIEKDGKKFVAFSLKKGGKGENRGKWPESRSGEYLHFVVHKRNMDTTETVTSIAQSLKIKPNNVNFAGTKDRRGITSQLMSIRKGEPSRLYSISKGFRSVFTGNYCFKSKPLRLGDLKGNQFRIALRNVEGSDEQVNAGLESLKNNGFVNYYGLQRFGSNKAVPTSSIGKALLQSEWKKAIDLILEPRESFPQLKSALEEWKASRNAEEALKKLNGRTSHLEELLLKGIVKYGPNDMVNALSTIPLNTQLMYLHAYQSLIFNKAVSQRLKEFGFQPIVGDLVLVKSEKQTNVENNVDEITDKPVDTNTQNVVDPDVVEVQVEEILANANRQEVRYLSQEDLSNYKMEDIVLPLPGYDVVYPNNSIGTFMKDLLKEDGLTSQSLEHHVKRYSVRGAYRHIIARAHNVSWKIVHYNLPDPDFIISDYDELRGKEAPKDVPDGKHKAVVLSMCLDLSTYATMAVREVTKTDTSASIQASMSAAAAASAFAQDTESVKTESDGKAEDTTNNELATDASVIDSKEQSQQSSNDENTNSLETIKSLGCASSLSGVEAIEVQSEGGSDLKRKADVPPDDTTVEKKMKEI